MINVVGHVHEFKIDLNKKYKTLVSKNIYTLLKWLRIKNQRLIKKTF